MNLSRRQLLSRAGLALGAGVVGVSAKEPEGTLWSVYQLDLTTPSMQFRALRWDFKDDMMTFVQSPTKSLTFSLRDYTVASNLTITRKQWAAPRPFFPETDPAIWYNHATGMVAKEVNGQIVQRWSKDEAHANWMELTKQVYGSGQANV